MSSNRTPEFPCACRQWAGIWPNRWQFRFCIWSAETKHETNTVKTGKNARTFAQIKKCKALNDDHFRLAAAAQQVVIQRFGGAGSRRW